ncbi:MAG: mercuric transporter MerT family protein [Nitrospiraceae bacterium]
MKRGADTGQRDESKGVVMTATSAGGLVAAFLASVCCVGPLILAALGVGVGATGFLASTAGFLKALLPYRPWFIGVTVVLLGVAFYQTYRRPKATCTPGVACVPASSRRKARVVIWVITAMALVLILAPYWLGL